MAVEMLTCAEVSEPADDGISTIPFADTIDASSSISRASEQEASVVAMRIVDCAKPAESGQMSLDPLFSARGHRHRRSICCVCDVSMAIARGMMQHSALVEYYAGAFDRLPRALICHQQISPVKKNKPGGAAWMGQDDVPIASSPTKGPMMR
eukprot:gene35485-45445_t